MSHPTALPPAGPVDLSDDEVPDFLERHPVALLAFLAGGEAASERMRARIASVAARMGGPGFGAAVVDVVEHRLVAGAVGVTGVPTVIVFVRGALADRLMGGAPEEVLEEMLRAALARIGA